MVIDGRLSWELMENVSHVALQPIYQRRAGVNKMVGGLCWCQHKLVFVGMIATLRVDNARSLEKAHGRYLAVVVKPD